MVISSVASATMSVLFTASAPPLQIVPATSQVVAPPIISVAQSLPKPLTELYHEEFQLLKADDLQRKAIEIFMSISVSPAECDAIETATKLQRDNEVWVAQRRGRITASSFHDMYTLRDTTSINFLCKRLLIPKSLLHIAAIKWGIDKEDEARQQYIQKMSNSH